MKPLPSPWTRKTLLKAFICLFLAGCASVEKRIEANVQLFSTYPPEIQSQLREGEIALGFDMKMVEIAKGNPTYVNLRQSGEGETTIWRYMQLQQYSRAVPVYDVGVRGASWVNVTDTEEIEVLRVEFHNGVVTSFEEKQ